MRQRTHNPGRKHHLTVSVKICLILFAVVFLAGIAGIAWTAAQPKGKTVEIVQDGEVLYQLDLADFHEFQTIEIGSGSRSNTVLIEDGKICISHAGCPDQTCVKMGWLQSKAFPIVCLPNHLVIQYVENNKNTVDSIAE